MVFHHFPFEFQGKFQNLFKFDLPLEPCFFPSFLAKPGNKIDSQGRTLIFDLLMFVFASLRMVKTVWIGKYSKLSAAEYKLTLINSQEALENMKDISNVTS